MRTRAVAALCVGVLATARCRRAEPVEGDGAQGGTAAEVAVAAPVTTYRVPVAEAPSRGAADAPVTVVEFCDFQSAFCRATARDLGAIAARDADVRVVFKQHPMSFNEHATLAAEAALAAHSQGRFWELHDRLMAAGAAVDREALLRAAAEIGLDAAWFTAALDEHHHLPRIEAERAEAHALGALTVPALFVNGERLVGIRSLAEIEAAVGRARRRAGVALAAGVPREAVYAHLSAQGLGFDPEAGAGDGRPDAPREVAWVDVTDAPALGPADAHVTVVMFGDLASALSARAARAALALQKKHETRVRLAFRHLPPPADETSGLAARLAVAAAEAGRFWELGDRLFGEGGADRARVVAHAREMGLDPDAVDAEPERARLQRIVDRDAALARRLGVRATPTFYVNGRLVAGVQPWDRFQALLLAEMATAAELVRQGVSPADLYPRLVAHHRAGLQPVGDRPAAGEEERATIDLQWAPTVGPPRAAVTVVMFMDYVTSAGRQVRGLPEALRASWKGSVRVAVKFHAAGLATGGQPLAETALAAHAQGRFWSYHDRLLAGEPPLAEEDWLNHARAAGLDVARLRRDVAERRFAARARADMAESAQVRAWFSPTFFVNGRRLSGVQTIDTLRPVIEEELTRRAAAAAGRGGD